MPHHHRRARTQDAGRRTKHTRAQAKAAVSNKNTSLCARNGTIITAYTLQLPQPEPSTLPHNTDAGRQHSRPDVTPDAHHHRRVRTQDAGHRTKHTHT